MDENKHSRPIVDTLLDDSWLISERISSSRMKADKILPTSYVVGNKVYNKEIKTLSNTNENLSTNASLSFKQSLRSLRS